MISYFFLSVQILYVKTLYVQYLYVETLYILTLYVIRLHFSTWIIFPSFVFAHRALTLLCLHFPHFPSNHLVLDPLFPHFPDSFFHCPYPYFVFSCKTTFLTFLFSNLFLFALVSLILTLLVIPLILLTSCSDLNFPHYLVLLLCFKTCLPTFASKSGTLTTDWLFAAMTQPLGRSGPTYLTPGLRRYVRTSHKQCPDMMSLIPPTG
jgi:hypothetical protein